MEINNYSPKDIYMIMAKLISQSSPSPIKAGAIIVSCTDRIIAVGCNSLPTYKLLEKYNLETSIIHAILKCVLDYSGSRFDLYNASVYTNIFPCSGCVQVLLNLGISNIFYETQSTAIDSTRESMKLLNAAGVGYHQYVPDYQILNHIAVPNLKEDIGYCGGALKSVNKNGCSNFEIRYCSNCDAPISISNMNIKNIKYCYRCGIKFGI